MLLAIDIGNSNINFGLYDRDSWRKTGRIQTVLDKMPDEYVALFRNLLAADNVPLDRIDRVILGSVVPPLTGTLSEMVNDLVHRYPLIVGPGVKTGIRIRTDNPAEVGADIVANAVAAYDQFKGSSIVVSFGTALTFTAVAEPGDLLGVAIAPGLNTAVKALSQHTAQLPSVQLVPPPSPIGRNTIHSIQSGVLYGYVGMVEALIKRIRAELPGTVQVIATGGQALLITPLTDLFDRTDPWMTLDGLRIIAARNA